MVEISIKWLGFIVLMLIVFIVISIAYRISLKESELREDLLIKRNKHDDEDYQSSRKNWIDSLESYKSLVDILLTSPVVYARGSMRKFYEVRANGVVYTRVRVSKMNEAPKRENVQGELYFIWSNNQYISKIQLIQALGYKDPKLVIKYINENLVTIEDLKKTEKGSELKTKVRTEKPKSR